MGVNQRVLELTFALLTPRINDANLDAQREEVAVRTTVTINDELVARAAELTGRTEASALFRLGLEALVERESARRLAALGGSDPHASVASRHRRDRE